MLVDGHAHLDAVEDLEEALARARRAGIAHIVGVGMELASNRKILALAERHPDLIRPAVGYHPWSIRAEAVAENLAFIDRHLGRCAALGEVGLDYKVKVPKDLQREVFEKLLSTARRWDRPVIVHSRFSHGRSLDMVAGAGLSRAVFHWYSGPLDVLEKLLDAGYMVSATPAVVSSPAHRAAMAYAPLERIMIETDAPVAYQGIKSEPADLLTTLKALGRLKNLPESEVAAVTGRNAAAFFGLEKAATG
jgi:TatD DNase family protein